MENQLMSFESDAIRKIWFNDEWYFSVVDIIGLLTNSPTLNKYWEKTKKRMKEETLKKLSPNWRKMKFLAPDEKMRPTDCANTEGVFRMLMSVPSPKAEPFKLWLAALGKQAIDDTENPELAIGRAKELYKAKGYSDQWIDSRSQSTELLLNLTIDAGK